MFEGNDDDTPMTPSSQVSFQVMCQIYLDELCATKKFHAKHVDEHM